SMFSSMFRSGDLDDGDDRHWLYMFSGEVVYDGDEAVVEWLLQKVVWVEVQVLRVVVQYAFQISDKIVFQVLWVVVQLAVQIRDNVVVSNVAGCGSSCCSYVEGGKLEENQDEDTSPSENTSEISVDVEGFKLPQEEVVPIRRSVRTHRAPDRLCLNVEVEEHSLEDLNEPTNYKAKILDPESNNLIDAMNVECN
ncbi:hypothetical protein Tco_1421266, partial [Tanacetum coccineum]